MKKMKGLLNKYRFNSDMQYFEMIADHFNAGREKQMYEAFSDLPKTYKLKFITAANTNWQSGIPEETVISLLKLL